MKQITIFLTIALLFVACNTNQKKSNTENVIKIELNNGEKWKVNDEMKPFINKENSYLDTYISTKKTDYKTLAKLLKTQNNELIKSCTMEGAAHDELHNWLLPHIKLITALEKSDTKEQANKIITKLTASFHKYNTYFN